MATDQAERPSETDETPGNQPSSPEFGPDQLRDVERSSVGQSSSPSGGSTAPGKVSYNSDGSKHSGSSSLSTSTTGHKVDYDTTDDIPDGEVSLYSSSATTPSKTRFRNLLGTRRRKAVFGGGLVSTIIGLVFFFTLSSGPFEFIHIAQLLTQFHFSGLQSQQDDRFTKSVRLFRFVPKGQIEKTRMGYLGNKFGNSYENKLNASGLISTYSDIFGLFNGYQIDITDSESPFYPYRNDPETLAAAVKDATGIDIVQAKDIKGISAKVNPDAWMIPGNKLTYLKSLKLNSTLLKAADANKLSASIGARFLCVRAACSSLLHPLTNAAGSAKTSIEEWWKARNETDTAGSQPGEKTPEDRTKDGSGDPIAQEITAEEKNPKTPAEITKDLGAKGAAALGLLCIARSIASEGSALKASQVQVLVRMGVESMAIGSQVQSGQDVNLNQLRKYSELLHGTDSSGKVTSWDQSKSIQANLGNPSVGRTPDATLQNVTDTKTPFDFLLSGIVGTALSGVCGTIGSIIQIIAGGIASAVQGVFWSAVLSQTGLASDLANWLAGSTINVDSVGEDYGNSIDYGAALAANDQSIGSGGAALSSAQTRQLQRDQNLAWNQQFAQKSLVYKLFSRDDERSAISKLIDRTSPDFSQNITNVGASFLSFSHSLASLSHLFTATALAAAPGWNYGFPIYGFSETDMDNAMVQNPYQNAEYVQGLLDSGATDTDGKTFIQKAQDCFGVTISQVPIQTTAGQVMQWDVTTVAAASPQYGKIPADCADRSDSNWLQVRFFVMDTETMNSMACYAGDDQACTDIGFSSSQSANSGTTSGSSAPLLPVCSITGVIFTGTKTNAFGNCGSYGSAKPDWKYNATLSQGAAKCSYSGAGNSFTFPSGMKGTASITYTLQDTNDDGTSNLATYPTQTATFNGGPMAC